MAREMCPICLSDEHYTSELASPGLRLFTCSQTAKHKSGEPVQWKGADLPPRPPGNGEGEGLIHELGVLNDLIQCVHDGEGWVEYGIVEHRYSELSPDAFSQLLDRFGHHDIGEKKSGRYSASVYLARALGMLRDKDQLEFRYGRATGVWAYNGEISYWAKPPRPLKENETTYEDFVAKD